MYVRRRSQSVLRQRPRLWCAQGGGRPYPSLPDKCRYDVTYDRFIFIACRINNIWPWSSEVKLHRKTILVATILTDARPRDYDSSWPWPRYDLDPKPKLSDDPDPCPVCKTILVFIIVIHMQTLSQQRPRDCDSWPWPCHDPDPVVTLTLNRNWIVTLTHVQSTTTTTGHDLGSSSALNALTRGQIICNHPHFTVYYSCTSKTCSRPMHSFAARGAENLG